MSRPRKNLPPGSKGMLISLAKSGTLKESSAAQHLGLSMTEFRRLLRDNQAAKEIWDEALATERDALIERLHKLAEGGDRQAICFLLAARHGMSDKQPAEAGKAAVQVVFNLPSAMNPADYMKAIQVKQEAIGHDGGN